MPGGRNSGALDHCDGLLVPRPSASAGLGESGCRQPHQRRSPVLHEQSACIRIVLWVLAVPSFAHWQLAPACLSLPVERATASLGSSEGPRAPPTGSHRPPMSTPVANVAAPVDDETNPFESPEERLAVAAATARAAAVAAGQQDVELSIRDGDEDDPDAMECQSKPAAAQRGLIVQALAEAPSPASPITATPSPDASSAADSPSPGEDLSPTAAALRVLAEGPPKLPESMSRYAHAVPDLSHFGSAQDDGTLPELQIDEEPDVWRTRGERLARTVFGAVIRCQCEVNDEVRLTVWLLALAAALIWAGFLIAESKLKVVTAADLAIHERLLAIAIGGCFAVVACALTIIQIRDHYKNWVHPPSQRCVVKILLMVPVYCVSAWLSLIVPHLSLYFDFIRACYEAFVIYTFMILLTKYLGGHSGVTECLKYKSRIPWPNPFCCLPPVRPNSSFLYYLKYGTLQYAASTPILSLLAVVMNTFGYYGEGEVAFDRGYIYITFLLNMSQLLALYTLVWLYVILKNELQPFRPFNKFLVVKAVVFFTFWQSVAISWAAHVGWIKPIPGLELGEVEVGLQDFLVCVEMFVAACCHKYAFGFETYRNGTMKLLMDQRAFYLAQKSYQRAVALARFRENERRIDAGLPPLPVDDGVVASVLPAGADVLGASDEAVAAANAQQPAPAGAGAEVDVRLVRVVATPSPTVSRDPSIRASSIGAALASGAMGAPVLHTTTVDGAQARAMMARAGFDVDADDEGDALFADHAPELDPELETFAPIDRARSALQGAASAGTTDRSRGSDVPPPLPLQRSHSSIQLTLGARGKTASVELGPVRVVRGQLASRIRNSGGRGSLTGASSGDADYLDDGVRSAEARASPRPLSHSASLTSLVRYGASAAAAAGEAASPVSSVDAGVSPVSASSTASTGRFQRASSLQSVDNRPGSASAVLGPGAALFATSVPSASAAGRRSLGGSSSSLTRDRSRSQTKRMSLPLAPSSASVSADMPTHLLILRDAPAFLGAAAGGSAGMLHAAQHLDSAAADSDPYPSESDYRDSDIDDTFAASIAEASQARYGYAARAARRGDDSEED